MGAGKEGRSKEGRTREMEIEEGRENEACRRATRIEASTGSREGWLPITKLPSPVHIPDVLENKGKSLRSKSAVSVPSLHLILPSTPVSAIAKTVAAFDDFSDHHCDGLGTLRAVYRVYRASKILVGYSRSHLASLGRVLSPSSKPTIFSETPVTGSYQHKPDWNPIKYPPFSRNTKLPATSGSRVFRALYLAACGSPNATLEHTSTATALHPQTSVSSKAFLDCRWGRGLCDAW
eukprot:2643281-Rhodomonas_salina.2